MNKQIEEMAKIIQKGELDRNKGVLDCTEFTTDLVIQVGLQRLAGAKALYNEGYRRQDEVAREFFDEIEQAIFAHGTKYAMKRLAELKEKYGVTDDDMDSFETCKDYKARKVTKK